jgi:hypothetical protein
MISSGALPFLIMISLSNASPSIVRSGADSPGESGVPVGVVMTFPGSSLRVSSASADGRQDR